MAIAGDIFGKLFFAALGHGVKTRAHCGPDRLHADRLTITQSAPRCRARGVKLDRGGSDFQRVMGAVSKTSRLAGLRHTRTRWTGLGARTGPVSVRAKQGGPGFPGKKVPWAR